MGSLNCIWQSTCLAIWDQCQLQNSTYAPRMWKPTRIQLEMTQTIRLALELVQPLIFATRTDCSQSNLRKMPNVSSWYLDHLGLPFCRMSTCCSDVKCFYRRFNSCAPLIAGVLCSMEPRGVSMCCCCCWPGWIYHWHFSDFDGCSLVIPLTGSSLCACSRVLLYCWCAPAYVNWISPGTTYLLQWLYSYSTHH